MWLRVQISYTGDGKAWSLSSGSSSLCWFSRLLGGFTTWSIAEGPCGTPAHPSMPKDHKMLLVKSRQDLGWEAITDCLGTTLLKGNDQVKTCNFSVSTVWFFSWFVVAGMESPKQGLSSAPARAQEVEWRHLVSPPGSNIKVTSSFKSDGRARAQVKDFGFKWAGRGGAAGEGYVNGAESGEESHQQPVGNQMQFLMFGASLRHFHHSSP